MRKQKKRSIAVIIAGIALVGIVFALFGKLEVADDVKKENITDSVMGDENTVSGDGFEEKTSSFDAGCSIQVSEIGSYSGTYMEDASDVEVSDVMMIKVKNTGEEPIQYAEVTLFANNTEVGLFKFSTLMPEETILVLESEKKVYDENVHISRAIASNVALFQNKPELYSDKIKIQSLDGGFNITNISDMDITEEIVIYFKDCQEELLMGGITYRGRIEGGLKKGEIRQVMSSNFTENNTCIMFVTIDG